jgi:hypothetical protein
VFSLSPLLSSASPQSLSLFLFALPLQGSLLLL